ncbi:rhodanese-like domain-containing protein [Azonexus hydrophilus]|uniref:Rhodanese-like domain-containing protein n=1 Tax=Azonexus hydrophilus TaxID=418702 RepID=A0ABZ2XEW3_9RHOO|nr:rhodanese-like domain-containing protein [Azonexus hydrophilus]
MKSMKFALAGLALAFSASTFAADWAPGSTNWSTLPEIKVTKLSLYLTPKQAYDMKSAEPKGVALFDVRTRAEAMYVGMASTVDALVPFVEHQEIMSDWDEKRTMYRLEPNQDFVPEIERRMGELGLAKDAPVILLCRSGDRSSRAADRLKAAGFTKVYSVPEGFEGDRAGDGPKKGQRVVNGWKNADLPWSYRLEKARMYFPR